MRETRIRTFLQLELKACLNETDWVISGYMCSANKCSEEEYPSRPLPIPPDYIDNLQSRLVEITKGILPPTLKGIPKTYYHLPARQVSIPSTAVQSDDMMGKHRDGEHNPLERPRTLHEEEKVVAGGTSSTDRGGDYVSQTEVRMDHEASQVAARHFELAM